MHMMATKRFILGLLVLGLGAGCTGLPSSFSLRGDRSEPGALNLPASQVTNATGSGLVIGLDGRSAAGVTGLDSPVGLAVGLDCSLYVIEYFADWIRKFTPER